MQRAFCQEYLIDLNATQSAIRAGYSQKTANVKASQLLTMPHVTNYIDKLVTARSRRTEVTADRVLEELARIAFVDPRNIVGMDEFGNAVFQSTDDMSEDDARCISEISQTVTENGGTIRVKMHDKVNALEKLGKHLKLFTDVTEHKFNVTEMGQVTINQDGEKVALEFQVGQEPNKIEDTKK